jgi:hypothetical protein
MEMKVRFTLKIERTESGELVVKLKNLETREEKTMGMTDELPS